MKGHIAFCPHFHQPHFQLHKTREEAYRNSYLPWAKLLEKWVKEEGFFINLHFSGPFLYWIKGEKPELVEKLKELVKSSKAGIIGGLADEPFIQLSSRRDDFFYQLKKYEELTRKIFGVCADEWQGIHIVERECGEFLLQELSYAARKLGAFPLYYLDAETFYNSYFAYPGSESDYCLKHFGFKDPYSKTTISHVPQEMLFFALRDEIGGQEYFALPVHSQYRYHLLKSRSFTMEDKIVTKPKHYYFYIKDALEKARELSIKWGKEIEPILVIFEDAEKFGQWSKDPDGDAKWLDEFFRLVIQDEELDFIGIKDYVCSHGFLDTYPARSSHSYTEWENWTAKRGIRGVVFGDQRLRLVMNRLRDLEEKQAQFEDYVIDIFGKENLSSSHTVQQMLKKAVLNSAERYEIVKALLEQYFSSDIADIYELINRVRHVVYQEDPKWASRHPSYGSSPYYDMQGLTYLFIAEKLLQSIFDKLVENQDEYVLQIKDWDYDGIKEVVISNREQILVIDLEGGCLAFHQIIDERINNSAQIFEQVLKHDIADISPYNDIYKISYPLIFTETDSSLACMFYEEGGRREVCRNSMRCDILIENNNGYSVLGDFATLIYKISEVSQKEGDIRVKLVGNKKITTEAGEEYEITLNKEFIVKQGKVSCIFNAFCYPENEKIKMFLVPQLITSASPSDEVEFKPHAWIKIVPQKEEILYQIEEKQLKEGENTSLIDESFVFKRPECISYYYEIRNGASEKFINKVDYNITMGDNIEKIVIKPAVNNYYDGYVHFEQSRLGYHASGLAINPQVSFKEGKADLGVDISWEFKADMKPDEKDKVVELLAYKK